MIVRKVFQFKSGTRVEVSFHHGRNCWVAQIESAHSATYGFGSTKRKALKNLRENLAMKVVTRLDPQKSVIFDELVGAPDEIWETLKK